MPLAHITTPLKHVICALGAAHRHFLNSGSGNRTTSKETVLESEIAAIEMYNSAITHIQAHSLNVAQEMDSYIVMMCCVVFVCIENLLGRHAESARHLQAGSQLLTRNFNSPPSPAQEDMKSAVFRIMHQLGQDNAIYNGNEVFHGLVDNLSPPDMGNQHKPFASYDEAWKLLAGIDVIYDVTFTSVHSPTTIIDDGLFPSKQQTALSVARDAFQIWDRRLELFQRSTNAQQTQLNRQDMLLSLNRTIWATLIKMNTFSDKVDVEDCKALLWEAESISVMLVPNSDPVFRLGGNLIPVLALICASCNDPDVRLRSISVLRSLRLREGIWDSYEIANACESMILTRCITDTMLYFPNWLRPWWR